MDYPPPIPKELDGLKPATARSLTNNGFTSKDKILEGLLSGDLAINNGMVWGKNRHQDLLNWLGVIKIEDKTVTTRYITLSNGATIAAPLEQATGASRRKPRSHWTDKAEYLG